MLCFQILNYIKDEEDDLLHHVNALRSFFLGHLVHARPRVVFVYTLVMYYIRFHDLYVLPSFDVCKLIQYAQ
jgi:hypothetical protein